MTPTFQPSLTTGRRGVWLAAAVIVLATWAAYANTFSAPFVFDDFKSIALNPTIHQLWPPGPALSPPEGGGLSGRPLVNLTLAFDYALGGESVRGYHFVNLVIHVLAALTLFGVVRRTLLRSGMPEQVKSSSLQLAAAAALLWALHPLQTEAVTYVSQRTESLMGLCYLLTLYGFVRAAGSASPAKWLTLSLVACWLGAASKEIMVTAPLLVLLYDRTFVAATFRNAWRLRWRYYLGLAASWILLAWLMRDLSARQVGFGLGAGIWRYALTESGAVVHYLRLALWPYPLVFDYGTELARLSAASAARALILAGLIVVTAAALRRRPALGFIGAWIFVILAPTSSVVPIPLQPMAEHRMYLPLAGVVVLGVVALHRWLGRWHTAVVIVLAAGLGVATYLRNEDYRSELQLWSDTVAHRPGNVRAQSSLGSALALAGSRDEARLHFGAAVLLAPRDFRNRCNLATVLLELDRPAEALEHASAAVRLAPGSVEAHCVRGGALAGLGRLDEAQREFEEALRLDPRSATARSNLAQLRVLKANPPVH